MESHAAAQQPPECEKRPERLEAHGQVRIDDYYWLRERENPDVIAYLNAENDYMTAVMSETEALQEKLAAETRARIVQEDTSVPVTERGFDYYRRTEEGSQYPIYCRRKTGSDEEVVILDVNELAEGHDFCSVSGMDVSTNSSMLAYAVDTVGRRKYTLRIKSLETGETLADSIPDVTGNLVWAEDNETLFYTRQDPQTLRWFQIFRHRLGTDSSEDVLVYEEADEEFSVRLGKTRSRDFIIINCNQTLSSETLLIDAATPESEARIFQPREDDHEYSIDHLDGAFYIRTNWEASNFRLMRTGEDNTTKESWQDVVPHSEEIYFDSFELFNNWLVIEQRENGLAQIRYRRNDGTEFENLDFGEPCYSAGLAATMESDSDSLRYRFSSLATPPGTFEFDMNSGESTLLKQETILGGFDRGNYQTERIWARASDGTAVPVSLVYHKDTPLDGTAPCLLYAYGSYGISMSASFNASRFNLIDRGFIFAIAHIRGGQEMGRHWYEDGKLLNKKNTFTDFIAVGRDLVAREYADPDRLYARGGSAGGLLMGAVANMAPELFNGIIADVPFVDVVTTMLDDTIPLTTSEYDEWGNPNDQQYYDYMLSYSPYDQVEAKAYPNILVTTGLHDSQVQYWEPAKWVARLREMKTDENLLLLKTNMSAGHGGASGRFDRYREIAFRHAFLLNLAGIEE
ncbi:MAG: S9 family peptidase [Planctomycetota bacterium]